MYLDAVCLSIAVAHLFGNLSSNWEVHMIFHLFGLFLLAVMFTTSNCAGYRTTTMYPERLPLGHDKEAVAVPPQPTKKDTILLDVEPTGHLTLKRAASLALLRNSELAAFSWEIRAREARALQASLLPNTEIGIELENVAGSGNYRGFDQTETTISLTQRLELAGKRAKRTSVAVLGSDLAAWDYEIKRLDVFTQVTQAYMDVLSSQQLAALNTELVELARAVLDMVGRRVQAGATSPAEESRANVALSNAQIELARSRRELDAARRRLAATWNSTDPTFQQAGGTLETTLMIPAFEQLQARISQSPEIARWMVEMERRQAILSLEKAQAIPDPDFGAGYRRLNESDANALVFALSVPIPFFDRNQGAIEEARARLNQGDWQRLSTELRIQVLMTNAYQALSTAFDEASMLQTAVLPQAQKAYDTINDGYNLGKFQFLDVLDAQRTLFDARSQYIRALTDYRKARADLERLIGQEFEPIQ
jgi:cobalt-zinc-cadmium efflux system outer membrane protein